MGRRPKDVPLKLIYAMGGALEIEAEKYDVTHMEILIALERLRDAMTEDFIEKYPKQVWQLQGPK